MNIDAQLCKSVFMCIAVEPGLHQCSISESLVLQHSYSVLIFNCAYSVAVLDARFTRAAEQLPNCW
jgi:hypothetical protein